jgi:hypothetical protein
MNNSLLQGDVVAEEDSEQGKQQEQQGKDGQESVIGEECGERPTPVVTKFLDDPEGERGRDVSLLPRVDAPNEGPNESRPFARTALHILTHERPRSGHRRRESD